MTDRDADDLIAEAERRGLRRALIVTALGLEMDAVRAHLTEPCSVQGKDGTIYECGVFSAEGQDWLVVVVETGAGTHAALRSVQGAHYQLGDFELQVLVGIGGSRKDDDAPLGSVVASDHVYMPYGGKETDGGRLSRPREYPIIPRVVELAKKLRRDKRWVNRIRAPLDEALPPPEAYPFEQPFKALVAPIASIESVLAGRDSELEAMLAKDYNDACVVEMEGYGAVFAAASTQTPSIVVRGISDLAKEKEAKTDKARQPVAACHAAAFGFEFLAEWGKRNRPPPRISNQPVGTTEPKGAPAGIDPPATAAPAAAAEPTLEATPATTRRYVFNVDMDPASASPEKIAELESVLRRAAGADALRVVASEEGSVRLVVEDPTGALEDIDFDALRKRLQADDGISLLGLVEEPEYRQLADVQRSLVAASNDLLSWPTTLPDGEWIERPELAQLFSIIQNPGGSTTAVIGDPGSGKSALLASFSDRVLKQLKWPVLAIKADLIPPEVNDEDQLAGHLNLPGRPSELLSRLARLRPVVLVIDQLDALAAYLDLRTGRLNVLMNLVRRLGELENVHIVLSSRTFEFEHDVRLRAIRAQDVRLQLPLWPKVSEILQSHGIAAEGWPEDAQEVMRSPQALTIYLGLDRSTGPEVFPTYQLMLEQLWAQRVTSGVHGVSRSRLVSQLAERMASEESLWLPRIQFEDHEADLTALEAAGIVTALGGVGSVGFTHQTLFDHALARSFAREVGRLSTYVLERQTSLFLRPKLWAALTYLRGVSPTSYATELEAIWAAQGLRRHLRLLLIDFIGQQGAPTDREALLLDRALSDPVTRALTLKAITGSAGWFARLASSRIAEAMTSDPDLVRNVLVAASSNAPDRVAELIEQRWLPNDANDGNTWMVLQSIPVWSEKTLSLADGVLQRTSISPYSVDYVVGTIGVEQPDIALRLVKSKLDRDLTAALQESARRAAEPRPEFASLADAAAWRINRDVREPIRNVVERSQEWDSLPALAEKWPREFLAVLWPWYLEAFAGLRACEDREPGLVGYAVPYDADFRFDDEAGVELPEPTLLAAARAAVEALAKDHPDEFRSWVAAQSDIDATPVHRLIGHVMAGDPQAWGSFAFGYLVADPRRWHLGSVSNFLGTTRKLIERTSEYWSADQLSAFESAVMKYAPPPPASYDDAGQRRSWNRGIRRTRLALLRALKGRASAAARRVVQEEERAFPGELDHVGGVQGGWIGSRMEAAAMAKASDEDILNAFKTLPDATEWHHPSDWLMGGNIQLSREFSTFAKTNPDRAFRIIDQLTPEIGTRAAGYALDALAEEGDPDLIQSAFIALDGRGFDGREFRMSCGTAFERLSRRKAAIRPEAIAIFERWLKQSPAATPSEADAASDDDDIDTGKSAQKAEKDDEDAAVRSPLWGYGGISVLPGGDYPVLSALVQIRLARKEYDELIDTLEAFLERPSDPRLWESLLHYIPYIVPGQPDRRPGLIRKIFDRYPKLLGTQASAHLLAYAQWWSDTVTHELLTRDGWGSSRTAKQAYGELVGLIRIVRPQLDWVRDLAAELLVDPELVDGRAGAAMSAVNVWSDLKHRKGASDLLIELIELEEPGVWAAVFDLFRLVDELTPDVDTVRVLSAIAGHIETAPKLSGTFIVERLQTLLPYEADLVGRIGLGLISIWRGELGDMRTSHALAAPELVDLAVTLHRLGPQTRELGTRLFEELIELDAYSARETLDQIDSRFRAVRGSSRPRLARRRPKAQRGRRSAQS